MLFPVIRIRLLVNWGLGRRVIGRDERGDHNIDGGGAGIPAVAEQAEAEQVDQPGQTWMANPLAASLTVTENESATPVAATIGDGVYVHKPPAETAAVPWAGCVVTVNVGPLAVGIDGVERAADQTGWVLCTLGRAQLRVWLLKNATTVATTLRSDRPHEPVRSGRVNGGFTFRWGDQRPTGTGEAPDGRRLSPEDLSGNECVAPPAETTGISTFR